MEKLYFRTAREVREWLELMGFDSFTVRAVPYVNGSPVDWRITGKDSHSQAMHDLIWNADGELLTNAFIGR